MVGRSEHNTAQTAQLVREAGGRAVAMVTDATQEDNVQDIVQRCVDEFGGLDVFFANIADPGTNTPLLEQQVD